MRNKKSKIVIKARNGGYTKIYANGKWQRKVNDINFHGYVSNDGITIECEFEKIKCVIVDNELVREKRIVRRLEDD